MDENLENNLLFNALRIKYNKFYEQASRDCCLFIVPRNKYLKLVNINENFLNHHILKPSKLLKSHYMSYKKCSIVDVEVDNEYLLVQYSDNEKNREKIKIIGEEIAYNENSKYKILMIEKPLVKLKINSQSLPKEEESQTIYFTFEECESYLNALSPVIIKEVREEVNKMLRTYLILPDYLDDAANRLKLLIDWSAQKYATGIVTKFDEEVLVTSLECFIIALVHDKIYPVIKMHNSSEERQLIKNLKRMENIHFVSIGCNKVFKAYKPSNQIYDYLNLIMKKRSPIEKIYLFKKILDKINNELNYFLNDKLYSPFSKCQYEILTDDLIAIVIFILIKFNLNNLNNPFLISEFSFIQLFSFYLHKESVYGYALTTFEVALNYIKDYHFEYNESPMLRKSISQTSNSSTNGSTRSSTGTRKSSETSNDGNNASKSQVRKQLNFTSIKMNEDLEEIAKLIEENSFSFQQLKDAEKADLF